VEEEVFCDSSALALVVCVGGGWADGIGVILRYNRFSLPLPHTNVRVFNFNRGKVVVGLVFGAALGSLVGVRCGVLVVVVSALVRTLSAWAHSFNTLQIVTLFLVVSACCLKICIS
jgi:hypothetical protein